MGHRHYGFYWQGANAEYNVYKTSALHIIPDNVSYDVAAMTDCPTHPAMRWQASLQPWGRG